LIFGDRDRLRAAYFKARAALLAERNSEGFWIGELSSSALATATAIAALKLAAPDEAMIAQGLRWLVEHQNADGGWGDTVKSFSNISTTMLCRAALHLCGTAAEHAEPLQRCEAWLFQRYSKTPQELAEAVRQRYGKDRTFAVPILTMCALAGLVPWNEVPRLPFELACLPQSWYRFARLPVVSYALPALIAIGQCVHRHRGTWNPLTKLLRWLGRNRSLGVLEHIQPSSGGYLEATPLTSFVVMALASLNSNYGAAQCVIAKGVEFIRQSMRTDGSWPIDTNLSIWVTTLSINALAAASDLEALSDRVRLYEWLQSQQLSERHPYTGADRGGFGWSHLPGSVPDCDDTPGATLALVNLECSRLKLSVNQSWQSWGLARNWILGLQNRDGGFPTFCRGWGKLPFDRSGCDLTAHSIRSLVALCIDTKNVQIDRVYFDRLYDKAVNHAFDYLSRHQRLDGSWLPLWFGNQHASDDMNPTYGTAKVLAAYRNLKMMDSDEARRGVAFLLSIQNAEGGWGGAKDTPSSVEETALAVEVLIDAGEAARPAVERGLDYLISRVENGTFTDAAPIGFYFAKLWYFEKLYPIIFTVAALGRALREC
jgi:squalene-hopene/tetraprenyl-beta-curcumene cyclase